MNVYKWKSEKKQLHRSCILLHALLYSLVYSPMSTPPMEPSMAAAFPCWTATAILCRRWWWERRSWVASMMRRLGWNCGLLGQTHQGSPLLWARSGDWAPDGRIWLSSSSRPRFSDIAPPFESDLWTLGREHFVTHTIMGLVYGECMHVHECKVVRCLQQQWLHAWYIRTYIEQGHHSSAKDCKFKTALLPLPCMFAWVSPFVPPTPSKTGIIYTYRYNTFWWWIHWISIATMDECHVALPKCWFNCNP